MADETNGMEPSDETPDRGSTVTGHELSAEDERTWRLWVQGVALSDYRSHSKAIAWLARLAMTDAEFRDALINDTENALSELPYDLKLPEGWTYRFLDNTPDTVNVVLPPRAGDPSNRTRAFSEELESRTSEGFPIFHDDFNIGPGKDPDFRDVVILNVAPIEPIE
jgi:hypothetical protein